jgi:hypothetical protein
MRRRRHRGATSAASNASTASNATSATSHLHRRQTTAGRRNQVFSGVSVKPSGHCCGYHHRHHHRYRHHRATAVIVCGERRVISATMDSRNHGFQVSSGADLYQLDVFPGLAAAAAVVVQPSALARVKTRTGC